MRVTVACVVAALLTGVIATSTVSICSSNHEFRLKYDLFSPTMLRLGRGVLLSHTRENAFGTSTRTSSLRLGRGVLLSHTRENAFGASTRTSSLKVAG